MTAIAVEREKITGNPNWSPAQRRIMALWADPAYRAARAAGHARGMARVKAGEGFLYLAEVVGTDEIKIGHALDPKARMAGLRADYFKICRLLKTMPGPLMMERALHYKLRRFLGRPLQGVKLEFYPRSVLSHPAIPEGLRLA